MLCLSQMQNVEGRKRTNETKVDSIFKVDEDSPLESICLSLFASSCVQKLKSSSLTSPPDVPGWPKALRKGTESQSCLASRVLLGLDDQVRIKFVEMPLCQLLNCQHPTALYEGRNTRRKGNGKALRPKWPHGEHVLT